ncbi:LOW QUALITY PROTEIN: Pirin-like protein [Jimgerdemannia flammicorona]|uniref:Pirin-like protein n=1 Tax=Jimgerdemannia flammicorona TaxID=994334 RepID=A0A433DL77_9FUNG|nr:LOW QUALITY PROTEIN: Pirin-like protein [Jimgerdemannia flammicorona]
MATKVTRTIVKSVLSREQPEGAGATVRRSIGRRELRNLDPFLMLDEFSISPPAGFPDHPHRGFETVTYMLEGSMWHEDFKGHKGKIGPGFAQPSRKEKIWTARTHDVRPPYSENDDLNFPLHFPPAFTVTCNGCRQPEVIHILPILSRYYGARDRLNRILHSEMPGTRGLSRGLQLWVNLPARHKMDEPNYQELLDENIPRANPEEGVVIKVIAGESYGVKSRVITKNPTMYVDIKMAKGKKVEQIIPKSYAGFIYTLSGTALFGGNHQKGEAHYTLVLSDNGGETIPIETTTSEAHFVIIAGEPIKEPIVQYGPFVMNTEQEIFSAMFDYERGQNGFEGASTWHSEISTMWD